MVSPDLRERARLYTESRNRAIEPGQLGDGTDGLVLRTNRKTAIKIFSREHNFNTELACYQLLHEKGITDICGFAIPQLLDYSRELMVIEMGIVQPPYILDFGKAYIHRRPPEMSPETMEETLADRQKHWGEHWPAIRSILVRLAAIGIHHTDPRYGTSDR